MKEQINKLVDGIVEDVTTLREEKKSVAEILPVEVMALIAICNAMRTVTGYSPLTIDESNVKDVISGIEGGVDNAFKRYLKSTHGIDEAAQ